MASMTTPLLKTIAIHSSIFTSKTPLYPVRSITAKPIKFQPQLSLSLKRRNLSSIIASVAQNPEAELLLAEEGDHVGDNERLDDTKALLTSDWDEESKGGFNGIVEGNGGATPSEEGKKRGKKMNLSVCLATQPMLNALNEGETKKNMITSPLSLNLVLSMVASGSKGHTLQQLLCALGAKNIEELNLISSQIMSLNIAAEDGCNDEESYRKAMLEPVVSIINGIWASSRCPLKDSFREIAKKYYDAHTGSADFAKAEELVKEVNLWVEKGTKGLIKNILKPDDLDSDTMLILANALYFKAAWQQPFHLYKSEEENFHLLNGESIKVPFLRQHYEQYCYGSFDDFKLIKLCYKSSVNNKFSMYVFLPDEKLGLASFLHKFNPKPMLLLQHCKELEQVMLSKVWLPKFKFSYQFKASDTMKKLGINLPFKPTKDITEMVDSTFYNDIAYISNILQMACIEVNEEGTEAAAVTIPVVCGCSRASVPPPPAPSFVADRPFFFMIKDEVSDIVLFTGVVLNPLSS